MTTVLLIVLVLAVIGVVYVLVSARRTPRIFARVHMRRTGPARAGPAYVGRGKELEGFSELITDPAARTPRRRPRRRQKEESPGPQGPHLPLLLLVTGFPGIGKKALLERFAEKCGERTPPRCAPVVSLRQPRDIADVLEEIAEAFEEFQPGSFREFERALDRYRRASAGQRTRGQESLDAVRDLAALGGSVIPAAERASAALGSQAGEHTLERWEGGSTLTDLGERFAADLVSLADAKPRQRLVLLFSDLDSRPTDADQVWLRSWLFPKVARRSILLVASATSDDPENRGLEGLGRLGRPEGMALEPLTDAEARRFVSEAIGLPEDSVLTDAIVARSGGNLDHLQGYRRLIERNPELRQSEKLPADADAWASSGPTYSLLHDLSSSFLEQVVVASSPLRWFNVNLLEAVAEQAGLKPGDDEAHRMASDVVRRGTRPAWIKNQGAGWGIDDPENRRALVGELRRLDPNLYRSVHRLAAGYHRSRLVGWGVDPPPAQAPDADIFSVPDTPVDGFEDSQYAATVAEWLYHLLAVAPDRAFPLAMRKGAEALFTSSEAAERVAGIDVELNLPARQRMYLDLLARAASALKESRLREAARILDQLTKAGAPEPLVKPVALHLLGVAYWNGDSDVRRARRCFDTAYELLGHDPLADDQVAIRVRCSTATWLAYMLANESGVEKPALEYLEEASGLAERLNDPALTAELSRVKGLVLSLFGNTEGAKARYDDALFAFQRDGKPDSVADVRRDRATLFLEAGQYDRAEEEFEHALALYASLTDFESRAATHAARVELYLKRGDEQRAEQDVAEARRFRPGDAEIENHLGNVYYSAGRVAESITFYKLAHQRAPESPVYKRNLASALFETDEIDEADKLLEGLDDERQDEWTVRLRAQLKRSRGQRADADRLIHTLKSERLREIHADPKRAGNHWSLGLLLLNWAYVLDDRADAQRVFREAADAFRKACKLRPDEAGYHWRLGQSLRALGQPSEAVAALQRAVELGPERDVVRTELAAAITELDSAAQQLVEARAALGRRPGDPDLLAAFSHALDGFEPGEALDELATELDSSPDEPEFHFLRAQLLNLRARAPAPTGDRFEASSEASEPSRPRFDGSEVRHELEWARELGERSERRNDQLRYLLALADHYVEESEWSAAQDCAEQARELAPDSDRVKQLLQRIRYGNAWVRKVEVSEPWLSAVTVEVSADLLPWVEPPAAQHLYDDMLPAMRTRLGERWGLPFPGVRVRPNYDPGAPGMTILLNEVPRYACEVRPTCLAGAGQDRLAALGITSTEPAVRPWDGQAATWIQDDDLDAVQAAGLPVWDPAGVIVSTVAAVLERHRTDVVSVQDVTMVARRVQHEFELPDERIPDLVTLIRRLVADGRQVTDLEAVHGELPRTNGAKSLVGVRR